MSVQPLPRQTAQDLTIRPRAPFRLDLTTWALRRRSHNAVDRLDARAYERVLSLGDEPVSVSVTQSGGRDQPRLSVRFAGGPLPIDHPTDVLVRSTLDRLLGLDVDLSAFASMASRDAVLAPLAARLRGLKPPRFPSVFEALVNAVACQQLSIDVGIHLLNRLTAEYSPTVSGDPDGPRAFPGPEELASAEPDALKRLGFSFTKSCTIIDVARAMVDGYLDLEGLNALGDDEAVARLVRVRGIGRWTAEYVLLRGLGRLHVFPGDDVGAHNKLRRLFTIDATLDHAAVGELVSRWQPYAGVVYFHLLLDSLSQAGLVDPA